mgnify:CR=1 FL=1
MATTPSPSATATTWGDLNTTLTGSIYGSAGDDIYLGLTFNTLSLTDLSGNSFIHVVSTNSSYGNGYIIQGSTLKFGDGYTSIILEKNGSGYYGFHLSGTDITAGNGGLDLSINLTGGYTYQNNIINGGSIQTGSGSDSISINADVTAVYLNLFYFIWNATQSLGSGDDSINLYFNTTAKDANGQNKIYDENGNPLANGIVGSNVSLGDGNNSININYLTRGIVNSTISSSGGNNTININTRLAGIEISNILLADGNDSIVIKGQESTVAGISNGSKVDTGAGSDTIKLSSISKSSISMGDGNDLLRFEGTAINRIETASISMGTGDDSVELLTWDGTTNTPVGNIIGNQAATASTLDGGLGYDVLTINDYATNYNVFLDSASGNWYVVQNNYQGQLILSGIEKINFLDSSVSTSPNTSPTAVSLSNALATIKENTSVTSDLKVADIQITDDGSGVNTVSLSGSDSSLFTVSPDGKSLFLKAGTSLDYETKTSYSVTVSVVDNTVAGSSPVSTNYTLKVADLPEDTNDDIRGTVNADTLVGVPTPSSNLGKGTKDRLFGDAGIDKFILGDSRGYFYNDSSTTTAGTSDYGFIADFAVGEKIQLSGSASSYVLYNTSVADPVTGVLTTGVGVYLNDGTGSGSKSSAWDSKDELIGFVANQSTTSMGSLTGSSFVYEPISTTPSAGGTPVNGTNNSDIITGAPSLNETFSLIGSVTNLGAGQIDKVTGNGGNDLFVIGDSRGVFYKDSSTTASGTGDFLWITDYSAGDMMQLKGPASNYVLNTSYNYQGIIGTGVFLNDGSGSGSNKSAWDSKDELIGFIQGASASSLSLTNSSQFIFI